MKIIWTTLPLSLALLSGCATPNPEVASAEQRARCEAMTGMGEGATHDHGRDKTGAPGRGTAMSAEHERCRRLLAQ